MFNCRFSPRLPMILRSNHNLISLLKNPGRALKKEKLAIKETQQVRKPKNNDEWYTKFPKEFFRKTKPNTEMSCKLYLVNQATATKIAQHLTQLPDQSITLVEVNPGPGLLTDLLIKSGIKDLRLFEGREEFLTHLQETFAEVHPDRVKLNHADLISLHKTLHSDDITAGSQTNEILSALPSKKLQNDIIFRLFCATGSTIFFKELVKSIVFQNGLLALGQCELYVALPSITYLALTSSTTSGTVHYRAISILFQIFFEYQLLDKFSRTDFLPRVTNTSSSGIKPAIKRVTRPTRTIKPSDFDPESTYFMKIVPRKELHQFCSPNQIQELWHFIKLNTHNRSMRIILQLEKLIPGCGAQLLLNYGMKEPVRPQPLHKVNLCELPSTTNPSMTLSDKDYYSNLNIFTQIGDLQPNELFTLFHEFRRLPEYSSCNFLPSLESVLLGLCGKSGELETGVSKPTVDDNIVEKSDK